jgi:hypothetical protein
MELEIVLVWTLILLVEIDSIFNINKKIQNKVTSNIRALRILIEE